MRKLITSLLAVSVAFSSVTSMAQQSSTILQIQSQLTEQRTTLEGLQEQLRVAKDERREMVMITVALATLSVISAVPGVKMAITRVKGQQPSIPTLSKTVVRVGAPLVLAVAASNSFATVRLASSDIDGLNKKIQSKLAEIDQAEQLLKTVK